MEGASESARRAVNALLDEVGSAQPRCALVPLREPAWLDAARSFDEDLYRAGAPHAFEALGLFERLRP